MRGGKRPGAGRKPGRQDRRSMTVNVSLQTLKRAGTLRAHGVKVNLLVEHIIACKYEQLILPYTRKDPANFGE